MAAPLATVVAVGAGVAMTDVPTAARPHTGFTASATTPTISLRDRTPRMTRSFDRMSAPGLMSRPATATADRHLWTTATLDVRPAPDERANVLHELGAAQRIGVTGDRVHGFAEVVLKGKARWVHAEYLTAKKPATDPVSMGLDFHPCAATASVERGLVPTMIRAWEAVCNAFPQITTYGGLGNRPEHDTGHAVDAMTDDPTVGYAIASFLQAHAAELDLYDIIYRQHIWTPVRASEGWRLMPDRGSPTANHMDHVHFGVN